VMAAFAARTSIVSGLPSALPAPKSATSRPSAPSRCSFHTFAVFPRHVLVSQTKAGAGLPKQTEMKPNALTCTAAGAASTAAAAAAAGALAAGVSSAANPAFQRARRSLILRDIMSRRRKFLCRRSVVRKHGVGEFDRTTTREPIGSHDLILVIGAPDGFSQCFNEEALAGARIAVVSDANLFSPEDVETLVAEVKAMHEGRNITGLVHMASAQPEKVGPELFGPPSEAVSVLDARLRSLILLVGQLVPQMRCSGHNCRILTISSEQALTSPSAWDNGQGMHALTDGFIEQYTEALAEQLHGTNVTVCGARVIELAKMFQSQSDERAFEQLRSVWNLPSIEAHGRVFPISGHTDPLKEGMTRGGSVLGPSADVRWALRTAVGRTADYPANGRPKAYRDLAGAIGVPESCLVWCHGASDVIVRAARVAVNNAQAQHGASPTSVKALLQQPTWPNAELLLKSGGISETQTVPYPDPWLGASSANMFWAELESLVLTGTPPALVYLVHPHFPTGFKAGDFASRLQKIVELSNNKVLFVIDQTYLGFTQLTDDDELLQALASVSKSVLLVRSMSKVEGMAALRLGYALASQDTARLVANQLPFSGGLYISELALEAAVAALCGGSAQRHGKDVLQFYRDEQEWFCGELERIGFSVYPSSCPFFVIRGNAQVLKQAIKSGAALQRFTYPTGSSDENFSVVCLVDSRALNIETLATLRDALQKEKDSREAGLPWFPADFMSQLTGS